MRSSLVAFLDSLNAAPALDVAWTRTAAYFEAMGVDWIHYAYAPSAVRQGEAWPNLTTLPEAWLSHYAASGFGAVNPAMAHCRSGSAPKLLGPDFFKDRDGVNPLGRRFAEDSRGLGVRSELVFPLRSLPTSGLGGFSAVTRLPAEKARRWAESAGLELRLAVAFLDARLLQLAREREAARVRLSPGERESLLWLAAGHRNDRIAEKMGITNQTVELHLSKARSKLGAATRDQALALALVDGLIQP